jgi:cytochrome c oxidase subunit 3
MSLWFREIIRESTFQGNHTKKVQKGLKLGFMLFLVSEAMLFISFFWAFFHSSLVPTIEIGAVWPPYNLNIIEPFSIPLLNTLILLLSGFYLTWSHKVLVNRAAKQATITTLVITIFLAFFFIFFQGYEYCTSSLTFNDGIYGSVFYIATGFHGLHVIVGTIFLIVNLYRLKLNHFTPTHHLGFEFGAWYWHFVDVIWIFLFLIIYCWGGLSTESVRFIY